MNQGKYIFAQLADFLPCQVLIELFKNVIVTSMKGLLAAVISIPTAFLVMSEWLNNYSLRIEIKWWFFAVAFAISAIIVALTVFINSYRASRINPINTLRYE